MREMPGRFSVLSASDPVQLQSTGLLGRVVTL